MRDANNLITFSFVTFHSEYLILDKLEKYKQFNLVVVENSLNSNLKKKINLKYPNVDFIIPEKNLGYGAGNNLAISKIKTKYCLIMNPDAYVQTESFNNFTRKLNKFPEFGIAFARFDTKKSNNFFINNRRNYSEIFYDNFLYYSSGCCMVINIDLLKKKNIDFFDTNIFLYNEEQDLVKRCNDKKIRVLLLKDLVVNHLPNSSHDPILNDKMEIFRHWHYMWSEFYYLKKHFGYMGAFKTMFPELIKSFLMTIWTFLTFKKIKYKRYKSRFSGLLSSMIGRSSYFRVEMLK